MENLSFFFFGWMDQKLILLYQIECRSFLSVAIHHLLYAISIRTLLGAGGNEYGQCGEEPERKDDTGRPLRRDITIPQRCAPKLSVRQVIYLLNC